MRGRSDFTSKQLHDLERSQKVARLGLGRASGVQDIVDAGPVDSDRLDVSSEPVGTDRLDVPVALPEVLCPDCLRDVAKDPWSYDDPPRRYCQTCGHCWDDAEGLAKARAENRTLHFSTPETMARKDRDGGRVSKRPSLVQERRERAAREKRRAQDRRKRKAARKARRR